VTRPEGTRTKVSRPKVKRLKVFFDTSALIEGLIDLGPRYKAGVALLDLVARRRRSIRAATAWACCLEFYAIATRLPEEFRPSPEDALALLEHEVLRHFEIHELGETTRLPYLRTSIKEGVHGGRIYDAHAAEIARQSGCSIVVSENTRHFATLEREGMRVLTAAEALRALSRYR